MKLLRQLSSVALAGVALAFSAGALAATGGGATIHNAATLTYNGGQQATDSVDVDVLTIATAPTITASTTAVTANAGDIVVVTYTITNNGNGNDTFSLAGGSVDTGVAGSPGLALSTASVALGASVTSAGSAPVNATTGTVYVPAGSETGFAVGDTVIVGGFAYTVASVIPGTTASTVGSTTTAEVPSQINLTIVGASPVIGIGTVPAGSQLGEQTTFTLTITPNIPTVPGTNGSHDVYVQGNTSAQDTAGSVVPFTTQGSGQEVAITVTSGSVQILKEARNVTKGGAFAASGVTAQPGDVLEYRVTATAIAPYGNAGSSVLVDELPLYSTYNAGTTTLNGSAVADDVAAGTTAFPLDSMASTGNALDNGIAANSATGGAGVIVESEAAVVIYRVTVQ